MKHFIYLLLLTFSIFQLNAQSENEEETGYPGDHFSLEGALDIFKNSDNLEDFEKKLNQEDSKVNNLDMNEDGEIDYIRIEDIMDGDVHAIVLQVPISENEVQDIATIEIEKTGSSSAVLQIVGNEDIYGEDTYVEPFEEVASSSGSGPDTEYEIVRVVVNVWGWSSVRFVYQPAYRPYVSPWRWRNYPSWYRPWRPRPFRTFVAAISPFRSNYRVVNTHRVVKAHRVYTPRKQTSVTVKSKVTVRTRSGKVTKRTTVAGVKGANGRKAAGKKTNNKKVTKTKKTKTAKNGNKKLKKTKTKKIKKNN